MRTDLWLPVVLTLPLALGGCPALLSDWTLSDSDSVDASPAGGDLGTGGSSGSGGRGGSSGSSASGGSPSGGSPSGGTAGASSGGAAPSGTGGATGGGTGGASSGGSSGSGGSTSGECAVGAVQCVAAQRQTCVGGVWLDNGAACDGWCINGACVVCKPGERQCASKSQPQTCSTSRTWVSSTSCNTQNEMCSSGECAPLGPYAARSGGRALRRERERERDVGPSRLFPSL
jgi:hypothetical protein